MLFEIERFSLFQTSYLFYMASTVNKRRIAKNTFFLYIRMMIVMAIGLYTSRAVLQNLGVEDFGIYSLIGGIVTMFAFLNAVINASTSRYITFAIGEGDNNRLQSVFSIAQINHIMIAVIVFILSEVIGLWLVYNQLAIPADRLDAAFWVMHFSILTCCLSIINAPLGSTIFAFEKINAYAIITTIVAFLKLAAVIALYRSTYDKLIFYSFNLLIVGIIEWFINRIYCYFNFKELKFKWVKDSALRKEMLQFSGWSFVSWGIFTSYNQGITILLNIFFGPVANAARGIAMQVYNNTYSFCNSFQGALNPQITKTFAVHDFDNVKSLVFMSSKYCYILLYSILFSLWLCLDYVLKLWLGVVPENVNSFVVSILLVALVSTLNNPLETAINAYGKLRKIKTRNAVILLMIVPVAYLYLKFSVTRVPAFVFYIQLFFEFIVYISNLIYIFPIIKLNLKQYIRQIWIPLFLYSICVVPIPLIIAYRIGSFNFLDVSIIVSISLFVNALCAYFIAFTYQERNMIKNKVLNKIKSRRNGA